MKLTPGHLATLKERLFEQAGATLRHQYTAVVFEPRGCDPDGWCDVGCLSYIGKGKGTSWTCWWQPETDEVQLRSMGERRRLVTRTEAPFPIITKGLLAEVLLDGQEAVLKLLRHRQRTTVTVVTPAEYEASREDDPMGIVGIVTGEDGREWQVRYDRVTGERFLRCVEGGGERQEHVTRPTS